MGILYAEFARGPKTPPLPHGRTPPLPQISGGSDSWEAIVGNDTAVGRVSRETLFLLEKIDAKLRIASNNRPGQGSAREMQEAGRKGRNSIISPQGLQAEKRKSSLRSGTMFRLKMFAAAKLKFPAGA